MSLTPTWRPLTSLIDGDFLDQAELAGQRRADEADRHTHGVASKARHNDPS